mgnify:CR=1 FL=1
MNEQQVLQITHELREYGYNSGDGEPLERQTALEAADLIEALRREWDKTVNPKLLTGALRFGQVVTGRIVAIDAELGLVSIKWEPKGEATT